MNNDEGGVGVAPFAKVMPVRVLDDDGKGTSDVVAEGIRWATREGATVINLSLADVPGQRRSPTQLITTDVELAIRQAVLDGVTVVAAAGNEGEDSTPYNRDLPALIVGATTRRDHVWEHSNYDDRTIFAPGVGIVSTYVGTPYAAADGTSFAAPIVAAGAALLRTHGYDEETTRRRLIRTARPVEHGVGRIDIAAALGIAKRVRSQAPPEPQETESEKPRKRRPQPVTQPSPIAPDPPPKKKPVEKPKPKKRDVAAADPEPTQPPVTSTPVAVPTDKGDGTLALGPENPSSGTPLWPVVVAGALLFGVVVALAGYVTSRRSV
jgi:subtilisin family serine protease